VRASRLTSVSIDHNYSQQPVPRDFPLFKRCEWLMINQDVIKRTSSLERAQTLVL